MSDSEIDSLLVSIQGLTFDGKQTNVEFELDDKIDKFIKIVFPGSTGPFNTTDDKLKFLREQNPVDRSKIAKDKLKDFLTGYHEELASVISNAALTTAQAPASGSATTAATLSTATQNQSINVDVPFNYNSQTKTMRIEHDPPNKDDIIVKLKFINEGDTWVLQQPENQPTQSFGENLRNPNKAIDSINEFAKTKHSGFKYLNKLIIKEDKTKGISLKEYTKTELKQPGVKVVTTTTAPAPAPTVVKLVNNAPEALSLVNQLVEMGYDKTNAEEVAKTSTDINSAIDELNESIALDDASIKQLNEMGFNEAQSKKALSAAKNNIDDAIDTLIKEGPNINEYKIMKAANIDIDLLFATMKDRECNIESAIKFLQKESIDTEKAAAAAVPIPLEAVDLKGKGPPATGNENNAGYREDQEDNQSCGRHALNNLLGGSFFVKSSNKSYTEQSLREAGRNLSTDAKIDLRAVCKLLHATENANNSTNDPETTYCPDDENYNIDVIIQTLKKCGYDSKQISLRKDTTSANEYLFGYIINTGAHWFSICKINSDYYWKNSTDPNIHKITDIGTLFMKGGRLSHLFNSEGRLNSVIIKMPDGTNFRRQFSIIEVFNRTQFTLDELIQDILPDAICKDTKDKKGICNSVRVFTRNSLSGYPVNRLMLIYDILTKPDNNTKIDIDTIIPYILNAAKYPLDRYEPETENILHMLQGKSFTLDEEAIKTKINKTITYYFEPLKGSLSMTDQKYTEQFEFSFDKKKDTDISVLFRVYHIVNVTFYAINGKPPDEFNKNPLTEPAIDDRKKLTDTIMNGKETVTSLVMSKLKNPQ
jgi:hypothetical protein